MTDRDDAILVRNAIKACLNQAGQLLHMHQLPTTSRPSYADSMWTATEYGPGNDFHQAQFLMTRAQYLRMLDVTDAAAYLRTEMLDALAAAKEQEEHDRARPKRVWTRSGQVGPIAPPTWSSAPQRSVYTSIVTAMGLLDPSVTGSPFKIDVQ